MHSTPRSVTRSTHTHQRTSHFASPAATPSLPRSASLAPTRHRAARTVINGVELATLQSNVAAASGTLGAKEVKAAQKALSKDFPNGIEACGADALRMTLLSYMQQGRAISLDVNRVVSHRHFGNKLWQATRFTLARTAGAEDSGGARPGPETVEALALAPAEERAARPLATRWLLSRFAVAAAESERGLVDFDLRCVVHFFCLLILFILLLLILWVAHLFFCLTSARPAPRCAASSSTSCATCTSKS